MYPSTGQQELENVQIKKSFRHFQRDQIAIEK